MTDRSLAQLAIPEFLHRLAAAEPTPGGGSVAALTAALAASLGRMVAVYTLGREKFAEVVEPVRAADERLGRAMQMFTRLIDEDAEAYGVLSAALKVDKRDPERTNEMQQAASLAGSVPLQTASLCAQARNDLETLHRLGNPMLRSDAEAALHLMDAALRAAAANVRVNLPLMDEASAAAIREQLDALLPSEG